MVFIRHIKIGKGLPTRCPGRKAHRTRVARAVMLVSFLEIDDYVIFDILIYTYVLTRAIHLAGQY